MEPIKSVIYSFLEGLEEKRNKISSLNPDDHLKKVLTKRELEHIKLNNFKKGILSFIVDSSSWMYYFNLKKESLIKEFKKDLKDLKNIRFSIGDVDEQV